MSNDTKRRLVGALITTAVIILLGLIIPLTLGLGSQSIYDEGVGDIIDFYQKFYWSLAVIWAVIIAFIIIGKNNKYGDSIGFYGIRQKPAFKFFRNFSAIQLTLLSLITFSSLFLMANLLKLGGFTGLRVLPQQFSKTQSLLFSTLLIPVSENLLLGAVIALYVLGLTVLAIKFNWTVSDYLIYLFVGLFLVAGTTGVIWHNTAYPSSDVAKYVIFFFWGLGAVISVAVGLFFIFLVMHMTNNFFIDFARLYSSDALITLMIGFIVAMAGLYWWLYRGNLFGGGKKKQGVLI